MSEATDPTEMIIPDNNYALSILYVLRLSLGDFHVDGFDASI